MKNQTLNIFAEDAICEKMEESKNSLILPKETNQKPWPPDGVKWYYHDKHTAIAHGDCREILPELEPVDLVLTDPPYLLPGMKGAGCFGGRPSLVGTQNFTDMGFDVNILDQFNNWFCFCSKHNLVDVINKAKESRWAILHWCKPNPVPTCNNTYLSDVEYCVHKWQKGRLFGEMWVKSLYLVFPCGNKETIHPNEKPLALIKKLVCLGTQESETILDPFMGSGTTLLAAKQLGRKAIGIEINLDYVKIAIRRLEQEYLPLSTLSDSKEALSHGKASQSLDGKMGKEQLSLIDGEHQKVF